MICASCGRELNDKYAFCPACGERVKTADGSSEALPEAIDVIDASNEPKAAEKPVAVALADDAECVPDEGSPLSEDGGTQDGKTPATEQPDTDAGCQASDSNTPVPLGGVATAEMEELLFSIAPPRRRLRAGHVLIPLLVIAAGALITAAIALYNASGVGITRAFISLGRDFNTRLDSTPFTLFESMAGYLADGRVTASVVYTDDLGDDFKLDLSLLSNSDDNSRLLGAAASVYGTPVGLELYMNSERLALGGSFFGDDYLGLRFDTFSDDFAAFAAATQLEEEYDIQEIEKYIGILERLLSGDGAENSFYAANRVNIYENFLTNITSEQQRVRISRGSKTVTAKLYEYTAEVDDITALLRGHIELFRSDRLIFNRLVRYFDMGAEYDGEGYYDPFFGGYYYGDNSAAAANAFLADLSLMLDFIDDTCEGTVNVKLYSVRNRLSVAVVELDMQVGGTALRGIVSADFGLDRDDDWMLTGNIWDSYYEYSFAVSWLFDKNGASCESSLRLTYGDSFSSEQLALTSNWDAESGVFALRVRTSDGSVDNQLAGNLKVNDDGFRLRFETAAQLKIEVTGSPEAEFGSPEFINLDKWDADTVRSFEAAVFSIYRSIYAFN